MPVEHHPLEQIVNVQWEEEGIGSVVAVGVEVADDAVTFGRIYRGESADETTTDETKPMKVETVVESGTLAFRSLSYALVNGDPTEIGDATIEVGGTPVFLMGGGWISIGQMHLSHDARDWHVVANRSYAGGYGFQAIVWDPDARAFFAVSTMRQDAPDIYDQVQLWRSPDGESWSVVTELTTPTGADAGDIAIENQNQITEMLLAHATKPENLDGTVPDGFVGYDPENDILMKPAALTAWGIANGPEFSEISNKITIDRRNTAGPDEPVSVPADIVYGVSFAGGVWTALGMREWSTSTFQKPAVIFVSTDEGETWTEVFERAGWYPAGIVSGDKKDIEGGTE